MEGPTYTTRRINPVHQPVRLTRENRSSTRRIRAREAAVGCPRPRSHRSIVVTSIRSFAASFRRDRPSPPGLPQPVYEPVGRRVRGVSEEVVDPGDEGDPGLRLIVLPLPDACLRNAQDSGNVPLEESEVEPALPEMIPKGFEFSGIGRIRGFPST